MRFSRATLDAFDESGSELAFQVERFRQNNTSVLAGVDFKWAERNAGDFVVAPVFSLDYDHANNLSIISQASLYGINVAQDSAVDNQNLLRAGVGIVAKRKNMSIQAGLNTAYASSHSEIGEKLSFTYQF